MLPKMFTFYEFKQKKRQKGVYNYGALYYRIRVGEQRPDVKKIRI